MSILIDRRELFKAAGAGLVGILAPAWLLPEAIAKRASWHCPYCGSLRTRPPVACRDCLREVEEANRRWRTWLGQIRAIRARAEPLSNWVI